MKSKRQSASIPPIDGFASFSEHILGNKLYPKQREVLNALDPAGSAVSFKSCNEGGKTKIVITSAILGALYLYDACVISTSGAFRQIEGQLTPKLQSYKTLFPGWSFMQNKIATRHPESFWQGFSTDEGGKFEGFHTAPGHPLMVIIDEAKTVKNDIFEAADKCKPDWLLVASSTGHAQGEFFATWSTKAGSFKRISQVADECPNWTEEDKRKAVEKWGYDHPLIKSMLRAEFIESVKGAVINMQALDENLACPPTFIPGDRKARCDFAWSETGAGDENVLMLRDGNRITIEAGFRDNGIHAICGQFAYHFGRLGLKPYEIEGDGDGKGAQIIEQLGLLGWPITPAYNGGKPIWNDRYQDRASEEWGEGNLSIIRKKYILPNDTDLYGQMLDRRIVPGRTGLFCIESKKAMGDPNREGGAVRCSPDRADALFGCMSPVNANASVNLVDRQRPNNLPSWAQPPSQEEADQSDGVRRYFS